MLWVHLYFLVPSWIYLRFQNSSLITSLICITSYARCLGFFKKHRRAMFLSKHHIVKNIASLRKMNIAHPYNRQSAPSGPSDFFKWFHRFAPRADAMSQRLHFFKFFRATYQMFYQIVCSNRCKVTLVTFVWYFSPVSFLNVFSNRLPEQKQSHIAYICTCFLQSEFPNVISNYLEPPIPVPFLTTHKGNLNVHMRRHNPALQM